MTWTPERLYVINVRGRAILSDHYIMGEWRRDPWPGFDLPEGVWARVKGREYDQATGHVNGYGQREKRKPISLTQGRWTINDCLRRVLPVPETVVVRDPAGDIVDEWSGPKGLQAFDSGHHKVFVAPRHLSDLVYLIDGEPAEWRNFTQTSPMHALDEKGKWLGAIMPVRRPL